jgi:hypothetical protein
MPLSDGCELYHGPPGELGPYLARLGYRCPGFMVVADFALALCVSPLFAATEYREPCCTDPLPALT